MLARLTVSKILFPLTFLLIFPFLAKAEPIILQPNNLQSVVDRIDYLHGDEIGLSSERISTFLQDNISAGYDSNLGVPEPTITALTPDKIEFSWKPIANAVEYIIRYKNLNTGADGTLSTVESGIVLIIPDDQYLITFQSVGSTSRRGSSRVITEAKGTKFIIIQDKPLAIVLNNDCECIQTLSTTIENLDDTPTVFYPYTGGTIDEFIHVNVQFQNPNQGNYESDYYLRIVRDDNENFAVAVYVPTPSSYCEYEMDLFETDLSYIYALNTDFSSNEEEYSAIRFGFNQGLTGTIIGTGYTSSTITVDRCNNTLDPLELRIANGNAEFDQVNIYPNPSSDLMTFDFITPDNIPERIQFLNNFGQVVEDLPVHKLKMKMDISHLPAGSYYLNMISERKTSALSFIKMN